MTTYPNQKTVTINREMPKQTKDNKRSYMIAYNDNIEEAMQIINKPSSIKLYFYLLGNTNNYRFALSTQDFSDRYGINIKSAKDAVNDLIEKGFLVSTGRKTYDFYELPQVEITPIDEIRKTFSVGGTDKSFSYSELVAFFHGDEDKANYYWRMS